MSDENDDTDISPPTSPDFIAKAQADSSASIASASTSSSNTSPLTSPLKRKRRGTDKIARSTLRKRLQEHSQSEGGIDSGNNESTESESGNKYTRDTTGRVEVPHPVAINIDESAVIGGNDNASENSSFESTVSDNDPSHRSGDSDNNSDASLVSAVSVVSHQYISSEDEDSDIDGGSEKISFLYEGSDMESSEALYEVLKLYVDERWTKTSLDKNVRLIKRMLPQPNDMPLCGRDALSQLEKLTASFTEDIHFYCVKCMELCDVNFGKVCGVCKSDDNLSTFYTFPIEDQIQFFFEQRDMATVIENFTDQPVDRKEGFIYDIQDGTEYKRIKACLSGKYDLIILWNTDGVSLSGSSKQELWPIVGTICELPPRVRSSFMIVFGVVVCSSKVTIDMNLYLKPFVENLIRINNNGGIPWVHPRSKITYRTLISAPALSTDAPAKANVLKCKQYNSRYGCNICEQKSQKISRVVDESDVAAEGQLRRTTRRIRRFLFQDDTSPAKLRTGTRMDIQGRLAEERGQSRKGVNGKAVISDIPYLDRANCVCAEYMHLALKGVVEYFLIFFNPGAWHVGKKLDEIKNFILGIKIPDFIKRRPRQVKDFKYWKASELHSFLLYYSLPLFKQVLTSDYFDHWMCLVAAMHILLSVAVSVTDLETADIFLRAFVRDVGQLYGEACYTYNLHTLLHLPLLVKRWGNLQSTSAFPFESYNGFIASHIHGSKNLGQEFINNVKIIQRVAILGNIVKDSRQSSRGLPNSLKTELLGKAFDVHLLGDEAIVILSAQNLGTFIIYKRAKVNSEIYTTNVYDENKKRANSFIQYSLDNKNSFEYGQLLAFVKAESEAVSCLVNVYEIVQSRWLFHRPSRHIVKNLVPVKKSEKIIMFPTNFITTKVLKVGDYFVLRPNSVEVNL